jgi:hypothetical protein
MRLVIHQPAREAGLPTDPRRASEARPTSASPPRADGSRSAHVARSASRPARRPSPRGWVPARVGAARHPRRRTGRGWPYLLAGMNADGAVREYRFSRLRRPGPPALVRGAGFGTR